MDHDQSIASVLVYAHHVHSFVGIYPCRSHAYPHSVPTARPLELRVDIPSYCDWNFSAYVEFFF